MELRAAKIHESGRMLNGGPRVHFDVKHLGTGRYELTIFNVEHCIGVPTVIISTNTVNFGTNAEYSQTTEDKINVQISNREIGPIDCEFDIVVIFPF